VDWKPKDDAMLLVGLSKHGYGSWAEIAADDELDLADKINLVEEKSDDKDKSDKEKDKKKGPQKANSKMLGGRVSYLFKFLRESERNKNKRINLKPSSKDSSSSAKGIYEIITQKANSEGGAQQRAAKQTRTRTKSMRTTLLQRQERTRRRTRSRPRRPSRPKNRKRSRKRQPRNPRRPRRPSQQRNPRHPRSQRVRTPSR